MHLKEKIISSNCKLTVSDAILVNKSHNPMGLLPTMHCFSFALPPWFEDGGMSDMKHSSVSVLALTVLLNFIDTLKCLMAYYNARTTKEKGS